MKIYTWWRVTCGWLKFTGLEQYNSDKSKCQEHFDVYKECKKKEVSVSTLEFSFMILSDVWFGGLS